MLSPLAPTLSPSRGAEGGRSAKPRSFLKRQRLLREQERQRAEAERPLREQAKQHAEAERQRAEQAIRRAEQAERCLAEPKAELRRLRGEQ